VLVIAQQTIPRGGVLTVSCTASVWAQELDLMGPSIVERLNEANRSLEPGKNAAWALETCLGSAPLSIVATGETPPPSALPGGSLACLSLHLALDDGPWLRGEPLILGSRGQPSRLLI